MHQGPVLIIETYPADGAGIASSLKAGGFEVRQTAFGEAVSTELKSRVGDMNLLSESRKDTGDAHAANPIRSSHQPVAIIVLTTHSGHEDLVARLVEALGHARPSQGESPGCMRVGDICLDALGHRVTKAEQIVHLTPKEFKLLRVLMEHEGLPLTHQQLLELVWGAEYASKRDYLRTYISQLRRKLESNPSLPVYLLTENHIGYRFQQPSPSTV